MRRIKGFRGNAVQVQKLEYDASTSVPVLDVTAYILAEGTPTNVVGFTRIASWSEDTRKMLGEFLDQLEKDICSQIGEGSNITREGILDALNER